MLWAGLVLWATGVAHATTVTVDVDTTAPVGAFRDLLGVNLAPRLLGGDGTRFDTASLFNDIGISQVRLHDGWLSVCEVYTDDTVTLTSVTPSEVLSSCSYTTGPGIPTIEWAPNDPAVVSDASHYDFTEVDKDVEATVRAGARVYLRLGENFYSVNLLSDTTTYAAAAANIYRHLVGTFAPGATTTAPVAIEVWNEPGSAFWMGTTPVFYDLYERIFDDTRAAGATEAMGGPGFALDVSTALATPGSLADGFVTAVGTGRLDFFSAHFYGDCPSAPLSALTGWLDTLRAQMTAHGLDATLPLHVTEWSIGSGPDCGPSTFSSARMRSWVGGALVALQEHPSAHVEAAHFYTSQILIDHTSQDLLLNPGAWAFWAHHQLVGSTRLTTSVCTDSSCADPAATLTAGGVVVGTSAVAPDGTIRVLLVNDGTGSQSTTVHLTGTGLSGRAVTAYTPTATAAYTTATSADGDGIRSATTAARAAALATVASSSVGTTTADSTGASVVTLLAPRAVQVLTIAPATTTTTSTTSTTLAPCASEGGDADGDGICTTSDNCPSQANPTQADRDGDGTGDPCDPQEDALTIATLTLKLKPVTSGRVRATGALALDGPLAALDPSAGVAVTLEDPTATLATVAFAVGDCHAKRSHATCKTGRSKLKIATTGSYTLSIRGISLPASATAPFTLTLTTPETLDRRGTTGSCRATARARTCKEHG